MVKISFSSGLSCRNAKCFPVYDTVGPLRIWRGPPDEGLQPIPCPCHGLRTITANTNTVLPLQSVLMWVTIQQLEELISCCSCLYIFTKEQVFTQWPWHVKTDISNKQTVFCCQWPRPFVRQNVCLLDVLLVVLGGRLKCQICRMPETQPTRSSSSCLLAGGIQLSTATCCSGVYTLRLFSKWEKEVARAYEPNSTRAPNHDKHTERDRFFWWTVPPLVAIIMFPALTGLMLVTVTCFFPSSASSLFLSTPVLKMNWNAIVLNGHDRWLLCKCVSEWEANNTVG